MTFKTIEFNRRVRVATAAKMVAALDAGNGAISPLGNVAVDAVFQAVFFAAHPFTQCFITLVSEQLHVVTAHKRGVLDATVTLYCLG